MAEYFFELLTEEIPAWMLRIYYGSVLDKLKEHLQMMLLQVGGLSDVSKHVIVTSTPRRIVIFLPQIPNQELDQEHKVKGPPRKVAYDTSGNPTLALSGFLKKNSAETKDIINDGEYVQLRRKVSGRTIDEILRERIPQIIESLRWPKMMRWGRGEHSYIRPIHSIVSVLDGAHLPITIFGVASATTTVGHRTLAPQKIEVTSYNDYVTKLELARVIIDADRRGEVMAKRAQILSHEIGGTPSVDAAIWSQWQYLTEYPGVLRAEFERDYLALPEEVLVMVMRVHQKQLPIRTIDGKLTNSFLAVLDNDADPDGNAAYGNSFVTNARFADAKFFYETDRKRTLESRADQLAHLQFQEKLGNYLDKTERVMWLVDRLSGDSEAVRAAELSKMDLVTEMVKEFTELQGRVGGIYAREEGLAEKIWQSIYDQYLPQSTDDALPRSQTGAILSVADKIDSIAGFFRIDLKPTGSKDPFALRRAAQGIVQILLNRDKREVKVGIDGLIDLALAAWKLETNIGKPMPEFADDASVRSDLLAFFAERVRTLLEAPAYGFAYDEIAAAMEAGWASSLTDLVDRITAVKAMRNEPDFLSILDSAKRIANITSGQESSARIDPSKLESDVEKRLADLAAHVGEQIGEMIAERNYKRALETFAAMAPELETFFDEVMVMVEDEAVRRNRMALLHTVGNAVMKIADVTKIVVDRREYRP